MCNILKTATRKAKRTQIGGKSLNRRLYIPCIGRTRGDLLSLRGMSGNRQRCLPSTER